MPNTGVFFVRRKDLTQYLKKFNPAQLRYDSRTPIDENYFVRTFGDSKGLSFDRILIYPPKTLTDRLKNNNVELAPTSRSKFYVAITRARFSVGIVYDYESSTNIEGVEKYKPEEILMKGKLYLCCVIYCMEF